MPVPIRPTLLVLFPFVHHEDYFSGLLSPAPVSRAQLANALVDIFWQFVVSRRVVYRRSNLGLHPMIASAHSTAHRGGNY